VIDENSATEAGDYGRIARAIEFLESHHTEQPTLEQVAGHLGLSPFHCQRLFRRWAGVSPKRFLQALTVEHAKSALRRGASVLDAAFESGLSGPGRLHDLLISMEGMSPGEYKKGGQDLSILYGFHPSPFGQALIGITERGVCGLVFATGSDRGAALQDLQSRWPGACLKERGAETAPFIQRIFSPDSKATTPIHLLVRGTNFQIRVWQALLRIPAGSRVSYGDLAQALGKAGGARAIGGAVGANPVGFLIPCHRVIRQTGALGGYRWGLERKRAMLAWEGVRRDEAGAA
jgi:AraC family transcriptional regulator of adaptative response/methylated-DNA-[protein]-cysteine methyltransferase